MVEENLIEQGLELMLFGMGTVVVFLTLLVLVTNLMSALMQRFVPPAPEPAPDAVGSQPDAHVLAVISAAVHKHRSRRDS